MGPSDKKNMINKRRIDSVDEKNKSVIVGSKQPILQSYSMSARVD